MTWTPHAVDCECALCALAVQAADPKPTVDVWSADPDRTTRRGDVS